MASDLRDDETEELFGTPQYISPEQLIGMPGDNRSDIYSLGATLYHALSGRFPFIGTTPTQMARKHLTEPLIKLTQLIPEIPEPVSQLVEIMLAKRPQHRYPDAGELVADLERVRQGSVPMRQVARGSQEPIDLMSSEPFEDPVMPEPASATGTSAASTASARCSTTPRRPHAYRKNTTARPGWPQKPSN